MLKTPRLGSRERSLLQLSSHCIAPPGFLQVVWTKNGNDGHVLSQAKTLAHVKHAGHVLSLLGEKEPNKNRAENRKKLRASAGAPKRAEQKSCRKSQNAWQKAVRLGPLQLRPLADPLQSRLLGLDPSATSRARIGRHAPKRRTASSAGIAFRCGAFP